MKEIACFITPNGFGHATRMTAMLEALHKKNPDLHFHLFTTVPESLFAETLHNFTYHLLSCDIGLIQKNGLEADLPATITRLQAFLPFQDALVQELANTITGCSLVLCDIAPLGITVARKAGITSVLIENFTWDWIYQAYLPSYPNLQPAIAYLASCYQQVDIHICSAPVCGESSKGDLHCGPIFRRIRSPRAEIRRKLHCRQRRLVFISMGGIGQELPFIGKLSSFPDTLFLLAGQQQTAAQADNVMLLSRESSYYHPDLINAADLVVCKSGYSTVSECYQAGVPLVTVGRTTFPESKVLERFSSKMGGNILAREEFLSGSWLANLDQLCSAQRMTADRENGADAVAEYLLGTLKN